MAEIQWRVSPIAVSALIDGPIHVAVLCGNGAGLARDLVVSARAAGRQVATNLPPVAEAQRGSFLATVGGWPGLGGATSRALQIASVIAMLDPRALLVAVGSGVSAALAQPAIEWLQSRRVDPVYTDAASMADELSTVGFAVVHIEAAGPMNAAHIIELIDRRRAACEGNLGFVVLIPESIDTPHHVTDAHDIAVRRLAEWARKGEALWESVPLLDADTVEAVLGCDPLVAVLLADEVGGDDGAASHLWAQWRNDGLVHLEEGIWVASEQLAGRDRRFDTLFDDLPVAPRVGRELIGMAAQFGGRFCAVSVIRAWQRLFGSKIADVDELLDVFDVLEDLGVTQTEGWLLGTDGSTCWVYRFTSRGERARAGRLLPADDRESAARAVLHVTAELHQDANGPPGEDGQASVEPLDRDLVRAAKQLDEHRIARIFQARADRRLHVADLADHVALLLGSAANRQPDEEYPRFALEAAAERAFQLGELNLARAAAAQAVMIADQLEQRRIEQAAAHFASNVHSPLGADHVRLAHALRSRPYARLVQLHGRIHAHLGEHSAALPWLFLAYRHFEAGAQLKPSEDHLRSLAIAEMDLVRSVRAVDGDAAALEGLRRARDMSARLAQDHPSPTHLRDLAIAEKSLARSVRAVELE